MSTKVFVLALVASVLFVQAQAGTRPLEYQSNPKFGNFVDDALEYLKKLIEKVQSSISEAVENLNAIWEDLKIYADEIIEQETFKIKEEARKFGEELSKIKNDSASAGTDISDCLEGREQQLKELPANATNAIIKCGADKVDEGKKIVNDTVKAVQDTLEDTKEDQKELSDCGDGIESLACVARVVAKMTLQMTNIPIKITTQGAKATKLIASVRSSMETCIKDNAILVAVNGSKILEEITACANAKVHTTTESQPTEQPTEETTSTEY